MFAAERPLGDPLSFRVVLSRLVQLQLLVIRAEFVLFSFGNQFHTHITEIGMHVAHFDVARAETDDENLQGFLQMIVRGLVVVHHGIDQAEGVEEHSVLVMLRAELLLDDHQCSLNVVGRFGVVS